METLMDAGILIEATLLSFLLALWVTWLGLRGLFQLTMGARLDPAPIRIPARRSAEIPHRNLA